MFVSSERLSITIGVNWKKSALFILPAMIRAVLSSISKSTLPSTSPARPMMVTVSFVGVGEGFRDSSPHFISRWDISERTYLADSIKGIYVVKPHGSSPFPSSTDLTILTAYSA